MNALRIPMSLFLSAVLSSSLFLLMSFLIALKDIPLQTYDLFAGIHFGPVEIPAEINRPPRHKPPKEPEPPKEPPRTPVLETERSLLTASLDLNVRIPDLGMAGDGIFLPTFGGAQGSRSEGSAIPTVVIRPMYPREAAMNNQEGWVEVGFTITPTGVVSDAHVIDADPPRVFDKEALRAIRRWKFKPRYVDGVATHQPATQIIQFSLESE